LDFLGNGRYLRDEGRKVNEPSSPLKSSFSNSSIGSYLNVSPYPMGLFKMSPMTRALREKRNWRRESDGSLIAIEIWVG
jgi:hypothetical protein